MVIFLLSLFSANLFSPQPVNPIEYFNLFNFPYKINQPDATFELSERLLEISGLSMNEDKNYLAAINDEEGLIFLLDKETGQIRDTISFWKGGDYEGIEIVGNDAWISKSNGNLYQVADYQSDNRKTIKHSTFLGKENNVEGLAYDPQSNRLLISCKGRSDNSPDSSLKKAIYAFPLDKLTLMTEPAYLLKLSDLEAFLTKANRGEHSDILKSLFSEKRQELKLGPSGIAIHPITGDIYIISSRGKLLIVMNRAGELLHLTKLDKTMYAQPEGICFDSDGTLYISNEGKKGKAHIYKFLYQN